ncbi:SGNH/GDSL hydrolase family protein [Candidatus Uabimicrobium amorphum]|uniref:SGNH hydrolase-type esterase domain-containing protein n=1 Tax=Uabimicrobium amorphum TaxID=2596890 RepID=A0A5S9IH31_UABAM|nr:SGNH/GDSL hydrolase family protein [Candidatus Uabimicrobium amorphum]BBM81678.1 hypothetical protein UABAM_00017 [Candidatus Uabimicrobium amorphum]
MREIFEYHSKIGYRFIPEVKARIIHESGGYLVQVNKSGFRCNHDFFKQKKSPYRALLFGDSYTAGNGVSNLNRYGDVLEKQIPQLEVFNFGLPGTGTDQQYIAYKEYAKDIDHDILILGVLVENIRRVNAHYRRFVNFENKVQYRAKPYFEIVNEQLVLKNQPVSKKVLNANELSGKSVDKGGRFPLLGKIAKKWNLKHTIQKYLHYQPFPEYNSCTDKWKLLSAILKEWISDSPKPVLVVPIPVYHYIEGISNACHYQNRFEELRQETGCILHDPLPTLRKYSDKEKREFRFKHDTHLTSKGHKALAESIVPKLRDLLLIKE